jgi:hypothetical protein
MTNNWLLNLTLALLFILTLTVFAFAPVQYWERGNLVNPQISSSKSPLSTQGARVQKALSDR